MSFEKCIGCSKRYDRCHSECVDYAIEKAFHDAARERKNEQTAVSCNLTDQLLRGVNKAKRRRKV